MSQINAAPGAPHNIGEAIERLRGKSGAIIAFGVLLMVLGVAALVFSFPFTIGAVTINGVLFIVGGIAEIAVGMHAREWGRFFFWLIGGVLYVVSGVFCILDPLLAAGVLTLLLGAGLVATGVVRFALAFGLPSDSSRLMVLLAALITTLLGLLIVLRWPSDSLYVIGTLLGVDLLFHGAGWLSFGMGLRSRR
jgi:uncharacterized membrane protein HdeD (DUF308 family)